MKNEKKFCGINSNYTEYSCNPKKKNYNQTFIQKGKFSAYIVWSLQQPGMKR